MARTDEETARLAAALRENLKRRKAQARRRDEGGEAPPAPPAPDEAEKGEGGAD